MNRQYGNWQYNNCSKNEQVYWGYPNFMQTSSNPMQSGFNWSSFVNSNLNKNYVENQKKNYEKKSHEMPSLVGAKYLPAKQCAEDYNLPVVLQTNGQISGIKIEISGDSVETHTLEKDNLNEDRRNKPKKRDPVTYCTHYCAHLGFEMEFVQIGQNGPPHEPIFTFCLKIVNFDGGCLQTVGRDKTKLGSKRYAAEAMVVKLYELYGPLPAQVDKRKSYPEKERRPWHKDKRPEASKIDDTEWLKSRGLNGEQNNPISNLHDWAKRKKVSEPSFEIISQEIIDTREITNHQGKKIMLPKSRFTCRCTFMEKKFEATDLTKKKAKLMCATAAWNEARPK